MDIYSNIRPAMKITKPVFGDQEMYLENLIDRQGAFTRSEVISAFCNDLKKLLELDEIDEIIQEIFAIEHRISIINDLEDDMELPGFGDFYQNLSPILLRAVLESEEDQIIKGWKEAIRIAVEEELYLWKEKLFE